ncbi:rRNA-processing protein fcf2 [Vitis vinifera]|uniref:rRNA-processing protein fcf2 n=1 Tax=Vitis vinifera TaxID=29760 RepID=A0A438KLN4_VITVI|nr:rRNA-processing protein fcf2 [Vitis vinifera]
MSESKAVIGLSWEPKLSLLSSAPKNGSDNLKMRLKTVVLAYGNLIASSLMDCLFLLTTLGRFDMPAPTITPELKKDLQLLKLRSAIDPKRHYKKSDSKSKTLPKYFQVGTVIESASDFFSGRLTKKERKASLADELLSNSSFADYRKRKVREIEEQNRPAGVDKWKIKGRQSWKRKKQRRH